LRISIFDFEFVFDFFGFRIFLSMHMIVAVSALSRGPIVLVLVGGFQEA